MSKEVILTGLRANAQMHLGNYLGAIKPMIELQQRIKDDDSYQLNMFIPDLHSFTTPVDHDSLYLNSIDNIRVFVAGGLDLDQPRTFIYRQSFIPAHSELTIILNNFAYFGELSRMTQFKDKGGRLLSKEDSIELNSKLISILKKSILPVDKYNSLFHRIKNTVTTFSHQGKHITVGLLDYPILMAADILLYGAQWVPVGDDQRQHLELTRDIAQRINNKFGDILTVPYEWQKQLKFIHRTAGVRIRSLKHPDKKMSKSVEDPTGTILLSDNPEVAIKKVMSATTDSLGEINLDWENQTGISNLLQILAIIKEQSLADTANKWQGMSNYGELKTAVAEAVSQFLTSFQQHYNQVDEAKIASKLGSDEHAMNKIANQTLLQVQKAVGLRQK